jgi:hypothetical protein
MSPARFHPACSRLHAGGISDEARNSFQGRVRYVWKPPSAPTHAVALGNVQPVQSLMKKGLAFLGVGIAGCATLGSPSLSLEQLVRRHTEARGGQAAIEGIRNLEARLRIVEPTYAAEGVWRVDRAGRMRIDVFIGRDRVFTEAFDGERAWQMRRGETHGVPASPTGTAALRHSAQLPTNILGLHEMAGHGHRLQLAGREEVAGVRYHVVVLTLDDASTTRYYVDPATFFITRARVRKALHPDIDPTVTTIETVWSDFRSVAGVRFAFQAHDTDLATGKLLQTTTLLELRANQNVDERLFALP